MRCLGPVLGQILLGDEIGTLNDYSYRDDLHKAYDSRWVHRPRADWKRYTRRTDQATVEGGVYIDLQKLITLRKTQAVFSGGELELLETGNEHMLEKF